MRPAAAPPSGINQYANLDGMTGPKTGTISLAGARYKTTASKKGAAANASAPSAIAALIPTPTDVRNSFRGTRNFTAKSFALAAG